MVRVVLPVSAGIFYGFGVSSNTPNEAPGVVRPLNSPHNGVDAVSGDYCRSGEAQGDLHDCWYGVDCHSDAPPIVMVIVPVLFLILLLFVGIQVALTVVAVLSFRPLVSFRNYGNARAASLGHYDGTVDVVPCRELSGGVCSAYYICTVLGFFGPSRWDMSTCQGRPGANRMMSTRQGRLSENRMMQAR